MIWSKVASLHDEQVLLPVASLYDLVCGCQFGSPLTGGCQTDEPFMGGNVEVREELIYSFLNLLYCSRAINSMNAQI